MVEVNIGIWCASIPALRALIFRRPRDGTSQARSRVYHYHSKERSGVSARKNVGGSSSNSQGVSVGLESFDLVMDDMGKVVKAKRPTDEVEPPQPAATTRKPSNVDSEWSVQSGDRIFYPGADSRV